MCSRYTSRRITHARPARLVCPLCGVVVAAPSLERHQASGSCRRARLDAQPAPAPLGRYGTLAGIGGGR
jgi:hypothetical protein